MRGKQFSDQYLRGVLNALAEGGNVWDLAKKRRVSYTTLDAALHARKPDEYARVKENRAHKLVKEIVELADEKPPLVEGRVDSGWIQWKKNQIDARKWVACKLLPRVYGDRPDPEPSGPAVKPADAVFFDQVRPEDFAPAAAPPEQPPPAPVPA